MAFHTNIVGDGEVTQSCPTLGDPVDCSPLGSSVHGDSPGQGYWSGLPCHPPGDLLDPGMEPGSPALLADSLPHIVYKHIMCTVIISSRGTCCFT